MEGETVAADAGAPVAEDARTRRRNGEQAISLAFLTTCSK